jgi:Diadenosine tetraphosphate (Ap4A) hydrolase and other HIT family hydrolases
MNDCIFCRIINGEIPADKLYEDSDMIIIKDIRPQAKLHYLLIPKAHYADLSEISELDSAALGKCLKTLGKIADGLGLTGGYRIISNKGPLACQSVKHLHIHVLGGQQLPEKMS